MGTWWRSEEMTYVSLIMSEEAAPACIRELGIMGCFQFTDLNPELTPFQRRFVAFIKRCDEIERKVRYVAGEVKKMGVPIQPAGSVDHFVETSQISTEAASGSYLLEAIESKLDVYESQLLDLVKYSDKLTDEYSHKVIKKRIMFLATIYFHENYNYFTLLTLSTILYTNLKTAKVEYHHLLVKARKFLGAVTAIENYELENAGKGIAGGGGADSGVSMTALMSDNERGSQYQADEMTFSNIAGVLPSADKVNNLKFYSAYIILYYFILFFLRIKLQLRCIIFNQESFKLYDI